MDFEQFLRDFMSVALPKNNSNKMHMTFTTYNRYHRRELCKKMTNCKLIYMGFKDKHRLVRII